MSIPVPLFPVLKPKLIDCNWFNVDQPCDDDNEITIMEQEHQDWLSAISQMNSNALPIGRSSAENLDDDEEEDDEDDNEDDDEESESHDDEEEVELELDVQQDRSSPMDINIRLVQVQGHGVR